MRRRYRPLPRSAPRTLGERPREVRRETLPNGLALILCPTPELRQAYVALYFGVGSRHEDAAQNGVSHALEHMLFRGSARFADATRMNAAAEDLGGFLEGATYRDHLMFATGCHPGAITDAVSILADLVQTPRYRAMEVERGILREELLEGLDADGHMVDLDNLHHRSAFGTRGLGMPIEGSLANLEALDRAALDDHRRRYLVAQNAVLSISGPMDADALRLHAIRELSSLPPGEPVLTSVSASAHGTPLVHFVRDTGSQVDIRMSFRSVPMHDRLYPALVLLARLLADGLASRMHAELVDRRGLAYALNAGLTTYADCGLFDFEVSVAPDRAAELTEAILEFASTAERFRYSRDELARTRRRYRYGMEFMSDSPADLASWYGRAALFGVETQTDALGRAIERIGGDAIRACA